MKHLLAALACAITITCYSQADWALLFQADPTKADGYFIVDLQKSAALGVTMVEVDILASELRSNGTNDIRLIETLSIDLSEGFFAQLGFSLWEQLTDPFRVHYQARGLAPGGTVVVDVEELCEGCYAWPEVCRETCISNLYAYTLVAYSNGALASIELHDGTIAGEWTRFYVKASNWSQFQAMFDPSDFGMGSLTWSEILTSLVPPQNTYVLRLEYPNQVPPAGARDYMGYPLGPVTETVYAVKRGKGPWEGLVTPTSHIAAQALYDCGMGHDVLRELYNANSDVQNAMSIQDMDPLVCQGWLASGGGLSWGSGYTGWCPSNDNIYSDLPQDVAEWVTDILACEGNTWPAHTHEMGRVYGGSGPNNDYTLADVANVVVTQWTGGSTEEVLTVPIGSVSDPKLWPVRRTILAPGLYEFTVVTNDGLFLKRFAAFEQPTVLRADFASFTTVSIYPVPVTDSRFAIDIDLGLPTSINLTVVNNMGHQFYSKVLDYDLPGEHKHVVSMTSQWPNGIYHAIFQFPDGSSSSLSFTVSDQ